MAIQTDPAILPQWKGHPVPWVTRWTEQVDQTPCAVGVDSKTGNVHCYYEDGYELRDKSGILWIRERMNRDGRPQFGDVSTHRQRASMNKRLCQVCGRRITSDVIRWLLSRDQLQHTEAGELITTSPPTCNECVPLSMQLCPHLSTGTAVVARVLDFEVIGIYGSVIAPLEGKMVERRRTFVRTDMKYPFPLTAVVARQQIVRFNKYVLEDA